MTDQARYLVPGTFSITASPTVQLEPNSLSDVAPSGTRRTTLHIQNLGTDTVYVGPSNVTADGTAATDGYPIPPQNLTNGVVGELILRNFSGAVYARCASGKTATVRVLAIND